MKHIERKDIPRHDVRDQLPAVKKKLDEHLEWLVNEGKVGNYVVIQIKEGGILQVEALFSDGWYETEE